MDSGREDNQRNMAGERAEEHATTAPLGKRRPAAPQAEPTTTPPPVQRHPAPAPQAAPTAAAPPQYVRSGGEGVDGERHRLATHVGELEGRLRAATERIQSLEAQLDERDQALEDVGEEVARTAADLQRSLAQRDVAERATDAAQQQRASADRVAQEALAQRRALEQAVATLEARLEQAQRPEHDPTKVGDDARAERERGLGERVRTAEAEVRSVAQRFATEVRARQDAERRADQAQREVRRLARGAEGLSFSPGSEHGARGGAAPPAGTNVDQMSASLAEAQRRREQEEQRADEAERRATEAERRVNDAEQRGHAVVRERVRAATEAEEQGTAEAGGAYAEQQAAMLEQRAKVAEHRAKEAEQRAAEAEQQAEEAERRREESGRGRGYPDMVRPRFSPAGQRRSATTSRQPAGGQSPFGWPNLSTDLIVGLALLGLGVILVLLLLAALIGIV